MRQSYLLSLALWLAWSTTVLSTKEPPNDPKDIKRACPDYKQYSTFGRQYVFKPHFQYLANTRSHPFSEGPLQLPFQRPAVECRTFTSPLVEKIIEDVTGKMVDKDLARLFENAFPNTLDTTVRWHVDGTTKHTELKARTNARDSGKWDGAQSFIVTGDINAEWLRDSTNQLLQYQPLVRADPAIHNLILGAINTQSEYVITSPYCNAFQPPPGSKLPATQNGQNDDVHPMYESSFVFECKYELDSLAAFLSLGNTFYSQTKSLEFLTPRWYLALDTLLSVLDEQSQSTFDSVTGSFQKNMYTFSRFTDQGTETLPLSGIGNPLNYGTGLIRSAFRPSDDATILGFLIPANAMMAVELERTSKILLEAKKDKLAKNLEKRAKVITEGIWEHGVVEHKQFGKVFAYEVDGYGGRILMDDANVPSLLALPMMGFIDRSDPVYVSTRKMLLSKAGNPYYLEGKAFHGIGGQYPNP